MYVALSFMLLSRCKLDHQRFLLPNKERILCGPPVLRGVCKLEMEIEEELCEDHSHLRVGHAKRHNG